MHRFRECTVRDPRETSLIQGDRDYRSNFIPFFARLFLLILACGFQSRTQVFHLAIRAGTGR